jgi:hypothetical protein
MRNLLRRERAAIWGTIRELCTGLPRSVEGADPPFRGRFTFGLVLVLVPTRGPPHLVLAALPPLHFQDDRAPPRDA